MISDADQVNRLTCRSKAMGRSLVVPVEVQEGEGLSEIIFRAAALNGYLKSTMLNVLLGLPPLTRLNPRLVSGLTFDVNRISDVLGNPGGPDEIAALMTKRVKGDFACFFGAVLRPDSITAHRRVSPRALRQAPYQRAFWSLRRLAFDPHTLEILLERCPECNRKLDFYYSFGACYCGRCCADPDSRYVDLRDYPQAIVDVSDHDALIFFSGLVDPVPETHLKARASLKGGMEQFERGEIFEVICFFARQLCGDKPLERLQPPPAECLIRSARAILDWPEGFHELAWELQGKWLNAAFPDSRGIFRLPRTRSKTSSRLIPFVANEAKRALTWNALSQLRNSRKSCGSSGSGNTGVLRRARPGTDVARLLRLIEKNGGDQFGADNVQHRAYLLRNSLSSREAAKRIGLPLPYLGTCFDLGLVSCADENLRAIYSYRESEGHDLEAMLLSVASSGQRPPNCLSLAEALSVADFTRANCWPTVLQSILSGTIAFWLDPNDGRRLSRRIFLSDLDMLSRILRVIPDDCGLAALKLTLEETCLASGLDRSIVERAIAAGLLDRDKKVESIWHFKARWTVSVNIQRRLRAQNDYRNRVQIGRDLATSGVPFVTLRRYLTIWDRPSAEEYFGLVDLSAAENSTEKSGLVGCLVKTSSAR